MKNLGIIALSLIFLASCGGSSDQNLDDVEDELVVEETETAEVVLEDREYNIVELFDLHATLDNPEDWVGKEVKIWFTLSNDHDGQPGKSNGEEVYFFDTFVDTVYYNMHNGELGLGTTHDFYVANPGLTFKKGDTLHATGVFDYSMFNEPRVEELELVNFK
jgi:hypothetical protein